MLSFLRAGRADSLASQVSDLQAALKIAQRDLKEKVTAADAVSTGGMHLCLLYGHVCGCAWLWLAWRSLHCTPLSWCEVWQVWAVS